MLQASRVLQLPAAPNVHTWCSAWSQLTPPRFRLCVLPVGKPSDWLAVSPVRDGAPLRHERQQLPVHAHVVRDSAPGARATWNHISPLSLVWGILIFSPSRGGQENHAFALALSLVGCASLFSGEKIAGMELSFSRITARFCERRRSAASAGCRFRFVVPLLQCPLQYWKLVYTLEYTLDRHVFVWRITCWSTLRTHTRHNKPPPLHLLHGKRFQWRRINNGRCIRFWTLATWGASRRQASTCSLSASMR